MAAELKGLIVFLLSAQTSSCVCEAKQRGDKNEAGNLEYSLSESHHPGPTARDSGLKEPD